MITSLGLGQKEGDCGHDAGMLRESNVLAQMANHMISPNGHIFSVYGDLAYPLGDGYIIPPAQMFI
jgi:hypothetical protein